jgi:NAD(P)-dependent dehydrogenase (short-subunit alcohol dehydrogenase family)
MARHDDFELQGALALVTGAGGGIGREIALELARKGSRVLAVDQHPDTAEKTAIACTEVGPQAHPLACDVADPDAVRALAATVHAEHGTLDVLVNNAGVGMSARFIDMTLDDWRWIRSINLDGVVHGCQAFVPPMLAKGHGHVVNVSSGLAYTMRATEPAYVTTKAAVLALSRCMRADWHDSGVGVSAVCPGVIRTGIIDAGRFLGAQAETLDRTRKAFGRGHPPELVARDVVVAIRKDKAVVPVGWEAKLGWWAHRLLPLAAQDRIARQAL